MYKPNLADFRFVADLYHVTGVDARLGTRTTSLWGSRLAHVYQIRGKEALAGDQIERKQMIKITLHQETDPFDDTTGFVNINLGAGVKRYDIKAILHDAYYTIIEAEYHS